MIISYHPVQSIIIRGCRLMISDMIKNLRIDAGLSQSELAKKLGISRTAVNAWEMSLSTPTTPFVVELAKIFHVSTDYLLGLEKQRTLVLDGFSNSEIELLYSLVKYFDEQKQSK